MRLMKNIHRVVASTLGIAVPPTLTLAVAFIVALVSSSPAQAAEHRVGGGFMYWKTIDSIDSDFFGDIDDDGLSTVLSYQYRPDGLFSVEVDLEYFESGFGGAQEAAYSPQVYALVGKGFYAGLGVGFTYSDDFDGNYSDLFYAARGGFNMALLPGVHLDLNANYRFDAWDELGDAGSDTIFLGAQVRFAF